MKEGANRAWNVFFLLLVNVLTTLLLPIAKSTKSDPFCRQKPVLDRCPNLEIQYSEKKDWYWRVFFEGCEKSKNQRVEVIGGFWLSFSSRGGLLSLFRVEA